MDIAARFAHARRSAGLTQRELAARAGVPQPTVARIESGRVVPRVDTLDRLLEACGYAVEVEPRLGIGIDRSQIRRLLAMTPAERAHVAIEGDRHLAQALAGRRPRSQP